MIQKSEKKHLGILALVVMGICVLIFHDFLCFEKLFLFTDIGSDTINAFYPQLVHTSNYLRETGIPQWSFHHGLGQNILPSGTDNPLNFLYYFLGEDRLVYALPYLECFKILLGACCFFFYLKMMSFSDYVAGIGGLLLAFCGYMIVGGTWYGHSTTLLYSVILLLAFEKLYQQKSIWLFPISIFLLGGTSWYFSLVFITIYALFRFFSEERKPLKQLGLLFAYMAGLSLLGIAFSGPAVTSILERIISSPRGMGGSVSRFKELSSMPFFGFEESLHYITLFMRSLGNDILGNGSAFRGWGNYLEAPLFYCGLLPLLLVPQLPMMLEGRKRIAYLVYLFFWLLLLVFPFFRYAFYLFAGDYYKSALSLYVPLTFLLFGMYSLHLLNGQKKKLNLLILGISILSLLALLWYPYFPAKNPLVSFWQIWTSVFIVLYGLCLVLWNQEIQVGIIRWIIPILLVFELASINYFTINDREAVSYDKFNSKLGYNDYTVDAIDYLKVQDISFFRVSKDYSSGLAKHRSINDPRIQNYYGTTSYSSFNQPYYADFLRYMEVIREGQEDQTRWITGLQKRPLLEAYTSVKYHLTKRNPNQTANQLLGQQKLQQFGDVKVFRNRHVHPMGFCYDHYILQSHFEKLKPQQKDFALLKALITPDDQAMNYRELKQLQVSEMEFEMNDERWENYYKSPSTLSITSHGQNHIEGSLSLSQTGYLLFAIPYDRGWQLLVNEQAQPLDIANIGFMGTLLKKGEHDIVLQYRSPFIGVGIGIAVLAFMLYFFLLLKWRKS